MSDPAMNFVVSMYKIDRGALKVLNQLGVQALAIYRHVPGTLYTAHADLRSAVKSADQLNTEPFSRGHYWAIWRAGEQPHMITVYPIREESEEANVTAEVTS